VYTSSPICKVSVQRVDGENAGGATSLRLSAGRHIVGLMCFAQTSIGMSGTRMSTEQVIANFPGGPHYRLEAQWGDGACMMRLVNSNTGQDLTAETD
jgi:hypothetical protein